MRRFAAAWGLLALTASAASPDPWLRMKSANFELFTTAGERSGRDLIRHFEQVHSFFAQAFKLTASPARPAQVIAFRSEKEFQPYRPSEAAAAFFQGGADHDFIVMQSTSSEHYPVAVHEYTHLLVRQASFEDIPVWLNEGLAELYSNLEPQGNKVLVGRMIPTRMHTLNNDRWIPLGELVAVDHNSPMYNEKARAGMFYAESWLLVHMLQMSPQYSPKFSALADALKSGDGAAAFLKTYGKTMDKVDQDLHDYKNGLTMSARLFPIQLPKTVDAPEIQASAGMYARLALAEMQSGNAEARSKGEEAYRALVSEFPDRWEVQAGMARHLVRQQQYEDAVRSFQLAGQLGAKDHRVYLDHGKVLTYGARYADAVAPFRKAVELAPDSIEAHVELGIALGHTNAFREAFFEFQKIKSITAPLATRYFYNFAYVSYRLNAIEDAKTLLARGRPLAKQATEIQAFDRLLEAINRPRSEAVLQVTTAAAPIDDGPAPRIVRRPPAGEPAATRPVEIPVAEGLLQSVECNGAEARLHVKSGDEVKVYLIDDAGSVVIRGGAGQPVEMTCGKQAPRTVRIGFEPKAALAGVAGIVRTLDFP